MSKRKRIKTECMTCKKEMELTPSTIKAGRKTCSYACKQKYVWSKPEYQKHMSLVHKKEKLYPNKILERKKFSQETLKRMSIARMGVIPWNKGLKGYRKGEKHPWVLKGENHYLYKKDRNQLVKSEKKHLDGRYREWMFAVKKRDNWSCRIADVNCDGRLEAHHILNWKQYPELRYQINNGITLCHAHHPLGRENEAKLSPFFQELVAEGK